MNITDSIIDSPEGGTASLTGEDLPLDGYYVGGKVSSLILDHSDMQRDDINVFIDYLHNPVGAEFIGWWTDSEDGRLYIDATDWFSELDSALLVGRSRFEIAIYDIRNQRELRLNYEV